MHKSNFSLPRLLLSLFLIPALVLVVVGQQQISDPGAQRMCSAVKDVQLPAQDQPTADEKKSLANCSSQDLYFGFGQPADPVKARKCAYVEMEQGKDPLDIAGKSVLMMVYANGKGADRSLDVAIKLACEMPGAPGDVAGNIYELERFRKAPPNARYSVCDHSAAPHLYKTCAILGDRFDAIQREKEIADITSGWSEKDRKAFAPLQQAAQTFFKSRASSEINLEPTFEVQEMAFMDNGFISKLQQLEKGDLPSFSAADKKKAQDELDEAYAATQKDPKRRWGTATVAGVQHTQQLWVSYKDAWVKFGKIKYPTVTPDSWETWLDQERLGMLEKLLP
ncbi:MAG TPA: hypothetical protein VJV96_14015 [Candidatus Angelobacter sp.]|nr:hypothetical protein [Candidatus Angelobacter sp.]